MQQLVLTRVATLVARSNTGSRPDKEQVGEKQSVRTVVGP